MKSIILNIETSTEVCSVCLSAQKLILAEQSIYDLHAHSSSISSLIRSVLNDAQVTLNDITAVSISKGPGSYTGLRVGASVAKGLCYALDCPLIEVDTLQSLALSAYQNLKKDALYLPMIDARRNEVYTAVYQNGLTQLSKPEAVVINETYFSRLQHEGLPLILTGNGAPKTIELLNQNIELSHYPASCSASLLAPLADESLQKNDFTNIAQFSPFYLKPPNITYAKKKI